MRRSALKNANRNRQRSKHQRRLRSAIEKLEDRHLLAADLGYLQAAFQSNVFQELQGQIDDSGAFAASVPLLGLQLSPQGAPPIRHEATLMVQNIGESLSELGDFQNVQQARNDIENALPQGSEVNVLGSDQDDQVSFQVVAAQSFQDDFDFRTGLTPDGTRDPIVNLETLNDNSVSATITWSWTFQVTVSSTQYIFDTASNSSDLSVHVEAELRDATALPGDLGHLDAFFSVSPDEPDDRSFFDGDYSFDVQGLPGELTVAPSLNGRGELNMMATATPSSSDFSFEFDSDVHIPFEYQGAALRDGQFTSQSQVVRFQDMKLHTGQFFSEFVTPIMTQMQQVLIPMEPAIDFLLQPVPMLGDLMQLHGGGSQVIVPNAIAKVIDLAGIAPYGRDPVLDEYQLDLAKQSLQLARQILDYSPIGADGHRAGLGTFTTGIYGCDLSSQGANDDCQQVGGGQALDSLKQIGSPVHEFFTRETELNPMDPETAERRRGVGVNSSTGAFGGVNIGFAFPILEDPYAVFNLMLHDEPVDLFVANMALDFGFAHSFSFPIYNRGPAALNLNFSIEVQATFDFGFGVDTDGFYLWDHRTFNNDEHVDDGGPGDGPEFQLTGDISVGPEAALNLIFAEVGLSPQMFTTLTVQLDLNDLPDLETGEYDGKIRVDELQMIVDVDPLALFNMSGVLEVGLRLVFQVDVLGITVYEYKFDLAKVELADFDFTSTDDEEIVERFREEEGLIENTVLGQEENGVLELFVGNLADQRTVKRQGEPIPQRLLPEIDNERLDIRHVSAEEDGTETVEVSFQGFYRQVFDNVQRIEVRAGGGNNRIIVRPGVRSPAILEGGSDSDYIAYMADCENFLPEQDGRCSQILGHGGRDILHGGPAADRIDGGAGDDQINGSAGDDLLTGGDGKDIIRGRDGNDVLNGGRDEDQLFGGDGSDTIMDGDHADTMDAGQGADTLILGRSLDSTDVILWTPGDGVDTYENESGIRIQDIDRQLIIEGGVGSKIKQHEDYPALEESDPSAFDDDFEVRVVNGNLRIASSSVDTENPDQPTIQETFDVPNVTSFNLSTGGGNDTVRLYTSGMQLDEVHINLGEAGFDSRNADDLTIVGSVNDERIMVTGESFDRHALDFVPSNDDDRRTEIIKLPSIELEISCQVSPCDNATLARNTVFTISGTATWEEAEELGHTGVGEDGLHYVQLNRARYPWDPPQFPFDRVKIDGGEGNDYLRVRTGASDPSHAAILEVNGGHGNDEFDIRPDIELPVIVNGGFGDDILASPGAQHVLKGGPGNDTLNGSDGNDFLDGGAGNDTINGFAGDDILFGGPGDDTILGGEGNDWINGTDDARSEVCIGVHSDFITDADVLNGGNGNDVLCDFGGVRNLIIGGAGVDQISTFGSSGSILGGDGNDVIDADVGTVMAFGGPGDDQLTGGAGSITLDGGVGNDTITGGSHLIGGPGDDYLDGQHGDQTLEGGLGNDILKGSFGNDTLYGGSQDNLGDPNDGADQLDGGEGDDTLYADLNDQVDGGGHERPPFDTIVTDLNSIGGWPLNAGRVSFQSGRGGDETHLAIEHSSSDDLGVAINGSVIEVTQGDSESRQINLDFNETLILDVFAPRAHVDLDISGPYAASQWTEVNIRAETSISRLQESRHFNSVNLKFLQGSGDDQDDHEVIVGGDQPVSTFQAVLDIRSDDPPVTLRVDDRHGRTRDTITVEGNSHSETNQPYTSVDGFNRAHPIRLYSGTLEIQGSNYAENFQILDPPLDTTIRAGRGADTITIENTSHDVTVYGEDGNDSVIVGEFTGTVRLHGNAGTNSVTRILPDNPVKGVRSISLLNDFQTAIVDNSAWNQDVTWLVDVDGPSVSGVYPLGQGADHYGLMAGAGNDTITVQQNAATLTSLSSGAGNDAITLESVAGNERLMIDGGTGMDSITAIGTERDVAFHDEGGTGDRLTLTAVDFAGNSTFSSDGGQIAGHTVGPGFEHFDLTIGTNSDTTNRLEVGNITGELSVAMGRGNNDLEIDRVHGNLQTAFGDGSYQVAISQVHGNLTLGLGSGTNTASAGSVDGNATITGGIGEDTVTLQSIQGTLIANLNGGSDTITVGDVGGNVTVNAGGNDDIVTLQGTLGGNVTLNGQSGDDMLTIDRGFERVDRNDVRIRELDILELATIDGLSSTPITYQNFSTLDVTLGRGDDSIWYGGSSATTFNLSGGAGWDSIRVPIANVRSDLTVRGGEGDDTIQLETIPGFPLIGDLTLNGEGGIDLLDVSLSGDPTAHPALTNLKVSDPFEKLNVTNTESAHNNTWRWENHAIVIDGVTTLDVGPALKTEIDAGPGTDPFELVANESGSSVAINQQLASFSPTSPGQLTPITHVPLFHARDMITTVLGEDEPIRHVIALGSDGQGGSVVVSYEWDRSTELSSPKEVDRVQIPDFHFDFDAEYVSRPNGSSRFGGPLYIHGWSDELGLPVVKEATLRADGRFDRPPGGTVRNTLFSPAGDLGLSPAKQGRVILRVDDYAATRRLEDQIMLVDGDSIVTNCFELGPCDVDLTADDIAHLKQTRGVNVTPGMTALHVESNPDGPDWLYLANRPNNRIQMYSVDGQSGQLRWLRNIAVDSPTSITFGGRARSQIRQAYITSENGDLHVLVKDDVSGTLNPLQTIPAGPVTNPVEVISDRIGFPFGIVFLGSGGITFLDQGVTRDVRYDDVEQNLSYEFGPFADRVSWVDASGEAADSFTYSINTGGGPDQLSINRRVSARRMEANLGDGDDTLRVVRTGSGTGEAQTPILDVIAGSGDDSLEVYRLAPGLNATIRGGDGADAFYVNGQTLQSELQVFGGLPESPTPPPFDTLVFDTKGNSHTGTLTPDDELVTPDGFVQVGGRPRVNYRNIDFAPETVAGPNISVSDVTIAEGEALTLDAELRNPNANQDLTYSWDLNSDGRYTDATSATPFLNWEDLRRLTLVDDGVYPVTVRVINANAPNVRDYQSALLTINNTRPTVNLSDSATAFVESPYDLVRSTFSFDDPGDDTITHVDVDWGDGTHTRHNTSNLPISHVYTSVGGFTVNVTSHDEDGSYQDQQSVSVVLPPVRHEGPYTIQEGQAVELNAVNSFGWDLDGDGRYNDALGSETVTFDHLRDLGLGDNGVYPISLARFKPDGSVLVTSETTLTIENVEPSLNIEGLSETRVGDQFVLSLSASDPGDDSMSHWTINWGDNAALNTSVSVASDAIANERQSIFVHSSNGGAIGGTFVLALEDERTQPIAFNADAVAIQSALESLASVGENNVEVTANEFGYDISFALPQDGQSISVLDVDTTELVVGTMITGDAQQASYFYQADGDFVVELTAHDEDGQYSATYPVTVAPELVTEAARVSGAVQVAEGDDYVLMLRPSIPFESGSSWSINWGDGNRVSVPVVDGSPQEVVHQFADDGVAVVSATLETSQGDIEGGPFEIAVNVLNVAPHFSITDAATEGQAFTLPLDVVDPGDDTVSRFVVDWGDGSQAVEVGITGVGESHVFTLNLDPLSADRRWEVDWGDGAVSLAEMDAVEAQHSYSAAGEYTIVASIVNSDGSAFVDEDGFDIAPDPRTATVFAGVPNPELTHTYADGDRQHRLVALIDDEDGTHAAAHDLVVSDVPADVTIIGAQRPSIGVFYNESESEPSFDRTPFNLIGDADLFDSGDMDGDGDVDIVVGSRDKNLLSWYENVGDNGFQRHVIEANAGDLRSVSIIDIDRDGRAEIVAHFNEKIWTYVYQPVFGERYERSSLPIGSQVMDYALIETSAPESSPQLVVVDNLFRETVYRELSVYDLPSGRREIHDTRTHSILRYPTAIRVANIDNDGIDDLIAINSFAEGFELYISQPDGDPEHVGVYDIGPIPSDAIAMDIDSDGDQDVVVISESDGTVSWYRNDAEEGFSHHEIAVASAGTTSLELADVDGDGRPDLLTANRDAGTIAWYRIDGQAEPQFTRFELTDNANDVTSISTADINGDGRFDLIAGAALPVNTFFGAEGTTTQIHLEYDDVISDPNLGWTIDWGDGSQVELDTQTDTASHIFLDDGIYDVVATATNKDGEFHSAPFRVTVENVRPETGVSGADTTAEGQTYRLLIGDATDPGSDDVAQYIVNWGDGTPDQSYSVAGTKEHIYLDDGSYDISVTLVDEDGNWPYPKSQRVLVADVAPSTSIGGPDSMAQFASYQGRWSPITDPGNDQISDIRFQFAPADAIANLQIDPQNRVFSFVATKAGDLDAVMFATNEDGEHLLDEREILVRPTASPGLTISPSRIEINEGDPATFSIQAPNDPITGQPVNIARYEVTFSDFTDPVVLNEAGSVTHTFADGDFIHAARVVAFPENDQGLLYDSFESVVTIHVNNVAPSFSDVERELNAIAGETVLLTGRVSDPGTDTLSARIFWGDDADDTDVPIDADGTFTASHVFTSPGTFEAFLEVLDDDGDRDFRLIPIHVTGRGPGFATWNGIASIGQPGDGLWWDNALNWSQNDRPDSPPDNIVPGDYVQFPAEQASVIQLESDQTVFEVNLFDSYSLGLPSGYRTIVATDPAESEGVAEPNNGDITSVRVDVQAFAPQFLTLKAAPSKPFQGDFSVAYQLISNAVGAIGVGAIEFHDLEPTTQLVIPGQWTSSQFPPTTIQDVRVVVNLVGELSRDSVDAQTQSVPITSPSLTVSNQIVRVLGNETATVNLDLQSRRGIVKGGPGTLIVNGNVGGVESENQIEGGFTIGNGRIAGTGIARGELLIAPDAILSPGPLSNSSIGVFTTEEKPIDGELQKGATIYGVLQIDVQADEADRLDVDGPLNLHSSSELQVRGQRRLSEYGVHELQIVSSRGVTGSFGTVPGVGEYFGNGVFSAEVGNSNLPIRYADVGVYLNVHHVAPGDADRDGRFDSSDLVQVFQAGEYEDRIAGNSTWETGDWNDDGEFTSGDLVLAFQTGLYEQPIAATPIAEAIDLLARNVGGAFHVDERRTDSNKDRPLTQSTIEVAGEQDQLEVELELVAIDAVFASPERESMPRGVVIDELDVDLKSI